MAHIIVLGAGISGISMAYELKEAVGREHAITLVSNNSYFQFTPSNPWVGVGWPSKENVTVELAPLMAKHGIAFIHQPAKRLLPEDVERSASDGCALACWAPTTEAR